MSGIYQAALPVAEELAMVRHKEMQDKELQDRAEAVETVEALEAVEAIMEATVMAMATVPQHSGVYFPGCLHTRWTLRP